MNKDLVFWLIVADLVVSAAIVFGRGLVNSTREYTMVDAIGGAIETGLIIWGLAYIVS
jgi:hypothetical protein